MTDTVNISAQIPKELGDMLNKVSRVEERSKSYYIKKGLEQLLRDRLEDLEDYEEGNRLYEEFLRSGEESIPFPEVKKDLDL